MMEMNKLLVDNLSQGHIFVESCSVCGANLCDNVPGRVQTLTKDAGLPRSGWRKAGSGKNQRKAK